MMDPIVCAEGLTKFYGAQLGLLGPNGTKVTLSRWRN
jgi:hypothetical protein